MPLRRFVYLSALANLGVSFVYSFIGSISGRADAFLPAFGISLLLAGVAMLAGKRFLPEQNWKRKPNK
jgi:predicted phage tail protein